jgi:hypothetical protein
MLTTVFYERDDFPTAEARSAMSWPDKQALWASIDADGVRLQEQFLAGRSDVEFKGFGATGSFWFGSTDAAAIVALPETWEGYTRRGPYSDTEIHCNR